MNEPSLFFLTLKVSSESKNDSLSSRISAVTMSSSFGVMMIFIEAIISGSSPSVVSVLYPAYTPSMSSHDVLLILSLC